MSQLHKSKHKDPQRLTITLTYEVIRKNSKDGKRDTDKKERTVIRKSFQGHDEILHACITYMLAIKTQKWNQLRYHNEFLDCNW